MGLVRKKDLKKTAKPGQEQGEQPALLSRTQQKKAVQSLQDLGERLVKLSDSQLCRIGLPEEVLKAVKAAKTIKKHGPLGRQMRYVGSLMRKCDPAPVREFLDALDRGKAPAHRKA
ncbi:MAG: ribosome biogenesis factor YjgA [Nitrospirota bacterium]